MNVQDGRTEGKHQIVVRMPVSLHELLVAYAMKEGTSVNQAVCNLVERETEKGAAA